MPRCEFGTPEKVSDDATEAMKRLAPTLRQVILAVGLHYVSALNPFEAFVLVLVNDLNITTEEEFMKSICWHDTLLISQRNSRPLLYRVGCGKKGLYLGL